MPSDTCTNCGYAAKRQNPDCGDHPTPESAPEKQTCPQCGGDGKSIAPGYYVTCPTCHGSGLVPEAGAAKTQLTEDLTNVIIPLGHGDYMVSAEARKRIDAKVPSSKRALDSIGMLHGIRIFVGTPEELAEADRQLQLRRKRAGLPPEGRYEDVRKEADHE